MTDIFEQNNDFEGKVTDTADASDKSLGNDFVDLDDNNDNQMEEQFQNEQQQSNAGENGEPGTFDQQKNYTQGKKENTLGAQDYLAGFSDEDVSDDDDIHSDFLFSGEENQQQQQTKPKSENQHTEEEDEDENEDQNFINEINKRFGKNFKSEKEVNDFINKTEQQEFEEDAPVISEEEQQKYDQNKSVIQFYENLVQKDDETLVRTDMEMQFYRENQRKMNEEEREEMNEKIENYKSNDSLFMRADRLRNRYENQTNNLKSFNNSLDEKVNNVKVAKQKHQQQLLKNNLKNVYLDNEGKFLGVKISTEDLQHAYNDVKSGDFMKRILGDPGKIAKLALIERKLSDIEQISSQPGYDAAIKTILKNDNNGKRMKNVSGPSHGSSNRKIKNSDEEFAM